MLYINPLKSTTSTQYPLIGNVQNDGYEITKEGCIAQVNDLFKEKKWEKWWGKFALKSSAIVGLLGLLMGAFSLFYSLTKKSEAADQVFQIQIEQLKIKEEQLEGNKIINELHTKVDIVSNQMVDLVNSQDTSQLNKPIVKSAN